MESTKLNDVLIYASAARTATSNVERDERHHPRVGMHLVINVTAIGAAPSVTPSIQGYDRLSNTFYNILVGAAITTVSTVILRVFPGATIATNLVANDFMPGYWRLLMTHANGDSITYSVAAQMM